MKLKMKVSTSYSMYFQSYIIGLLLINVTASSRAMVESRTICDHSTTSITCSENEVINVGSAVYGRTDRSTCISDHSTVNNANCRLDSALQKVTSWCNGQKDCSFTVEQPFFEDPCPGTGKYLTLTWECVPRAQSCPAMISRSTVNTAFVTIHKEDGGWFKDPLRQSDKVYYMARLKYRDGVLYEFNSPARIAGIDDDFYHVQHRVDGTGFIVYDGNFYYNKERTRDLIKYNLARREIVTEVDLPEANYHGTSPYSKDICSDINFAVDESGLWTIYATERNNGNIVVSKIDENSLKPLQTWHTSYEKLSALNAFIACGVLYVINSDTLQIDYIYNMTSGTEARVNIPILGINRTTSAVKYNPADKSLYIWDNGVASVYTIIFEASISLTPTPTNPTPISTASTTPTSVSSTIGSTNIMISSQTPVDSSKSTTSTIGPIVSGMCLGRRVCGGMMWPDTQWSGTAYLKCPGDSNNLANWTCGGESSNPEWITSEPDLSACGASSWLLRLQEEIESGTSSMTLLCQKLAQSLNNNQIDLGVGDIILSIELLNSLLSKATADWENAALITDEILRSTNALLQPRLKSLWSCMNTQTKTQTANQLADTLQRAAFFLAKDLVTTALDKSRTPADHVNKFQPYVSLTIRTEPATSPTDENNMESSYFEFHSNTGDVISLDMVSLIKSLHVQPSETLAVVYLSYDNLANYIEDSNGLGSSDYPVNSRLTTVSARRLLSTRLWSKATKTTNLKKPLILQFQHNHAYYSKHACAFWKPAESSDMSGSWWRSGCQLIKSNQTSTTCQCTHLTDFALLSSNKNFPPLGEESGDVERIESELFSFMIGVRAVCILSIILLCFVLFFLSRWRTQSDLTLIHINIVITALLSQLLLVIGIDLITLPTVCAVVAGLLHYTVLCSFIWAAIESFHLLKDINRQQPPSSLWKWYCVIGYVSPLLVVGLSLAVDHSAYVDQPACWLRTTGNFMWSIVAPCCVSVCVSVGCIATLIFKLNKRHTATDIKNRVKSIRSDVIKSCILITLLCLSWSLVFIWISGVPVMALVFAAICFLYGIASFVIHCCFTPKNRRRRSWPPFKKSNSRLPVTHQSYLGNSIADQRTLTFDYRGAGPRGETLTTLIPIDPRHSHTSFSRSIADEVAPLMPHDSIMKIRTGDSNMRVSERSLNGDNRSALKASRNSANSHMEAMEARDLASSHRRQCPEHSHQYEQPSPPDGFCSCTTSTSYSCCYDRLHMDLSQSKAINPQVNRCRCTIPTQQANPEYFRQPRSRHQYETVGSFVDEETEDVGHLMTRRPVCCHQNDSDLISSRRVLSCHVMRHSQHNHPDQQRLLSESSFPPTSTWQNSSYGFCPNSHDGGRKHSRLECCGTRNGRCSDPLSTDQGYDTDSQHPTHMGLHSRSDGNGSPESSTSLPEQDADQSQTNRNNSLSGRSENDHEVELINSASLSAQSMPNQNPICLKNSENSHPNDLPTSTHDIDDNCSVIDTSIGGSISVSDTISSWSGVPGSNPRASYPAYGLQNPNRKKNVDPQLILEQARLNNGVHRNNEAALKARVDKTAGSTYTLPGTTEAGTKARIDLVSGGVNMITNL